MSVSVPQPSRERANFTWVDLARVVAVFQVVLVHLSFPIFFKGDATASAWASANFYDSISRTGVPLFFMLSGALLLGKKEPLGVFFRKRFVKVGIPTLFWSAAYLLWAVEAYRNGSMPAERIALSMLKAIYVGDVEIHLWFLYILAGIYLAVPILRLYVSAASRREVSYFLVLWVIGTALVELAKRVTGFETALEIPVVSGHVGYFVLGYWLVDFRLSARGRWLVGLGFFAAVAGTYFGTALLSATSEYVDAFFYSYFSIPTIIASGCAFLLLKDFGERLKGKAAAALRTISAASFGIYLMHILVIDLLRGGAFFGIRLYSWMAAPVYAIPLTAFTVYVISFLIVSLLRIIPIVKSLVP